MHRVNHLTFICLHPVHTTRDLFLITSLPSSEGADLLTLADVESRGDGDKLPLMLTPADVEASVDIRVLLEGGDAR